MNDPDNVKCPNCKCTRVDNQVLKQENLGIAGQNHTYFFYRIRTTYQCIKCDHIFESECNRTL